MLLYRGHAISLESDIDGHEVRNNSGVESSHYRTPIANGAAQAAAKEAAEELQAESLRAATLREQLTEALHRIDTLLEEAGAAAQSAAGEGAEAAEQARCTEAGLRFPPPTQHKAAPPCFLRNGK